MGKKHSKLQTNLPNNTSQLLSRPLNHESIVTALDVSNDTLVSADDRGFIVQFSLKDNSLIKKLKNHDRAITQVLLSNDPISCFTASRDKTIKISNISSTAVDHTLAGHTLGVSGLSVNFNCTQLISGSRDCSVKLWDVETGSNLKTSTISRNVVTDIKFIEKENVIVQCSEDKIMKLWDSRILRNVSTFPTKQYFQTCCDVCPDTFQIVTGSTGCNGNGCEVILWDVRQLKEIHSMKEHSGKITSCNFFNKTIAISVSQDCSIKIWDLSVAKCVDTQFIQSAKELTSLCINKNNNSIFVGTFQDGVHVLEYDLSLRKSKHLFQL